MSKCPKKCARSAANAKSEDINDLSGGVGGGFADPQEMESGANLIDDRQKQVDYYQVLGVSEDANLAEIKKKWLKLSLIHHPDKEGGDEKMFAKINEAYKVLSNPEARKKFNDSLAKTYDQLRDVDNRDTEYHANEDFLVKEKDGRVTFDRSKFLNQFDQSRGQFKDLNEIEVVNEEEAETMPKKTIEQIMAERDAELDQYRNAQKSELFDPRKNMDEFNHVFTQFHKMTQRTDVQEVDFNDQLLAEQNQFSSNLGYAAFQPYVDYRRQNNVDADEDEDEVEKGQELSEAERKEILESLIQTTQKDPSEVVSHQKAQEPAKLTDLEERMNAYKEQSEMLANKEKEEVFFENKIENDDKLTQEEVKQLPDPEIDSDGIDSESSSIEL